ncbi:hypothetical protein HQ520_10330 [bacterium]|nr:hypothetical protein [bacterium]
MARFIVLCQAPANGPDLYARASGFFRFLFEKRPRDLSRYVASMRNLQPNW